MKEFTFVLNSYLKGLFWISRSIHLSDMEWQNWSAPRQVAFKYNRPLLALYTYCACACTGMCVSEPFASAFEVHRRSQETHLVP